MVDQLLSEALIAYVGSPGRLGSDPPEERVQAAVGDSALDLVPKINTMLNELYSAGAPPSSESAGRKASEWLAQHYPSLSDEAIAAAANEYAFNWK